jgi:RNA polymerase sigma-70 factor (ECF subfamily)
MGTVGTSTDEIAGERRQLINVAYRLLGSVTEAEDAVQDAYARWYGLSQSRQEEILSPGAWLMTGSARLGAGPP